MRSSLGFSLSQLVFLLLILSGVIFKSIPYL
jgi:hypothetical protein